MVGNTLIDNSSKLKLVDTLNEIISKPEINEICIATGYWDLKGTSLVTDSLINFLSRENTKLRLLIGKDPNVFKKDLTADAYKTAKVYPQDYLKIDLQNVEMNDEQYQKAAKMLIDNCSGDNPKIQVHIFELNEEDENQFFHSKCYIFVGKIGSTYGIIGSSNFTEKGLQGNSELNYLDNDIYHITAEPSELNEFAKGHYYWFNEKWKISKDWTKEFVIEVGNSPVGTKAKENTKFKPEPVTTENLTPYENYIKLLQDKFGMITDANFKSILTEYLPEEIKPLEYQLNAVQQCYSYMIQHGGFALGDVVGLGKTIVGILIIKYFIDVSASLQKSDKVLIIVPPAIKSSWVDTIKKFDKEQTDKIEEHVRFLTTGSLNHLSDDFSEDELNEAEDAIEDDGEEFTLSSEDKKQAVKEMTPEMKTFSADTENYGLVIIDESHKFRNSGTEMYIALSEYLESVNARTGYYPFIGLLSATMQNNSPRDIQNQLYLFEHEPKNSTFEKVEGRDLEHFFAEVNRKYSLLIHSKKQGLGIEQSSFVSDPNTKKELIALSKEVREKVLSDILVRRTRTDIKKHYSDDLKFPTVHGPENLYYTMDKKLAQLFSDTMNMIAPKVEDGELFATEGLGYYRYRATMFLDSKYDKVYSGRNMTAQRSSNQLARIMQILLVKRLESSFEAFKESLRNFQRYTQNMITMWENDTIFICPQIDVNKELNIKEKQEKNPDKVITLETCFNDIRAKIEKLNKEGKNEKNQNAEYNCADFKTFGSDKKTYIDYLKTDLEKINDL
ncbi:MAG: phospholipase D-like domain-containing protein, partial [Treponema sp.]|nr:phospholipase D-like domain-containing protein [Treponema sp.]